MTEQVASWFAPDGQIARRLPDFEQRPEQVEFAIAVERALQQQRHLCAEVGTGVGKSFAYLLPAVLHATSHLADGPVIVSTRTIALQGQLEHKDLPFLQAITPQEWTAITAVGRNNYVCLRRMHSAQREADGLFDRERRAELERIGAWAAQTHDGLRIGLDEPVSDVVWEEVQAEHGNCLHRACPHYEGCPYQRARRRLDTAQILVVNHALYMADVALRMAGAHYLPAHRVVIFDEAHHLERVATESLGLRLTRGSVLWHLRRLHSRRRRRSPLLEHGSRRSIELVGLISEIADWFFAALEDRLADAGGSALALHDEPLDDPLSEPLGELAGEVAACASRVTNVDARMELQARASGLEGLGAVVDGLTKAGSNEIVRWVESGPKSPALRSAPVSVADALGQWVFGENRTCVLTSATLAPPPDTEFSWLRKQLGIGETDVVRLGSPFDYRNNVRLELADGMPDPGRDPRAYLRACRDRTVDAVLDNGGSALVLCTSWSSVRGIAEALAPRLEEAGIALLVQGDAPLRTLLDRKRAEPSSVLVGTESLWEGIDVRGEALTLVVVTRFPFAQPDHPLTRARHRAIEQRGGNPFFEQSLPEAVLKFRQGFGRLIRSSRDRGRVLVLDPRARTRRYGRQFLDALPLDLEPEW